MAVVRRRHLLDGSGPIEREYKEGTLSRLVYKRIIIFYDSGSVASISHNFLVIWDNDQGKWVKAD